MNLIVNIWNSIHLLFWLGKIHNPHWNSTSIWNIYDNLTFIKFSHHQIYIWAPCSTSLSPHNNIQTSLRLLPINSHAVTIEKYSLQLQILLLSNLVKIMFMLTMILLKKSNFKQKRAKERNAAEKKEKVKTCISRNCNYFSSLVLFLLLYLMIIYMKTTFEQFANMKKLNKFIKA